jgi:hypothetical protein
MEMKRALLKLNLAVTPAVLGRYDGRLLWSQFGSGDQELPENTMRGWLNR